MTDPVESWKAFRAALADAGEIVVQDPAPDHPDIRAEGIRALSRCATLGLERFVERADVDNPEFFDLQTPIRKYRGDNPDQTYRTARIAGDRTYRVTGSTGGALAFELAVYVVDDGRSGPPVDGLAPVGRRTAVSDGTVRIVIAHRDPGAPNWLDPAGHPQGSVALRWFRSPAPLPTAHTQVVAHDEVAA